MAVEPADGAGAVLAYAVGGTGGRTGGESRGKVRGKWKSEKVEE